MSHVSPPFPSMAEVTQAAALLRAGGLVGFPTETVYGLAADALNEAAVARIFDVKGRPRFDPLIVHVSGPEWVERLTVAVPEVARRLMSAFWPGPLTLVLLKDPCVPDLVTSGGPTVGLRVPDHPVAQALLRAVDRPLAAPSANLFGRVSPTTAEHVREQLGGAVDLILDGGPCRVGVESTVLLLTEAQPRILRPGGIPREDLESVIGPVATSPAGPLGPQAEGSSTLLSPGTLPQHYAPRTPLWVADSAAGLARLRDGFPPGARLGLVCLAVGQSPLGDEVVDLAQLPLGGFAAVEVLAPSGDLREAAARFFGALRRLDAAGLDGLLALRFPNRGLGVALNDRLQRAAWGPSPVT